MTLKLLHNLVTVECFTNILYLADNPTFNLKCKHKIIMNICLTQEKLILYQNYSQ